MMTSLLLVNLLNWGVFARVTIGPPGGNRPNRLWEAWKKRFPFGRRYPTMCDLALADVATVLVYGILGDSYFGASKKLMF